MHPRKSCKHRAINTGFWLLIEIIVYTAFVTGYFFLVLLFLRTGLKHLFDAHRVLYAAAALPLIIGQAIVLELVLAGFRKTRPEKGK